MIIEIAKHNRMSERGSSLLRLIQNNEMPILDLLVRESVQNSLDAALEGDGYVDVDFAVNNFDSDTLSNELVGITKSLNKKYKNQTCKSLAIRDSHTIGLTGPLTYKDVKDDSFGNLLKLVYEISMPQQIEGAGGSWGLGKTVYFRIGIGLVFYYSRICDSKNKYSSRLSVCLVEDESKNDALIQSKGGVIKRGIAWWGQSDGDGKTMPITNEKEIIRILKILNIDPYIKNETGTTIIIPYINETKLLNGILPATEINESGDCRNVWWTDTVEEYLRVAIQRWYSPRLMNKNYKHGRWLRVKINGQGITKVKMLPIFRVVQELYNTACGYDNTDNCELLVKNAIFDKINLKSTFILNANAGFLAYKKFSRDDLLMCSPNNQLIPYLYLNKFDYDRSTNQPIIMFTRKPGMIVSYEVAGAWVEGMPILDDKEFIIGIFVANSSNILKQSDLQMPFEEYIRKSELADHTSWSDWKIGDNKPSIISKIQSQIKKKISEKYNQKSIVEEFRRSLGLRKALADALLPPDGFGNHPTPRRPGVSDDPPSLVNSSKGYTLKIIGNPIISSDGVKIDFELNCGKKTQDFYIDICIKSESGLLSADNWESEIGVGKPFPFFIKGLTVYKYATGKKAPPFTSKSIIIDETNRDYEENGMHIQIEQSKLYHISHCVYIHVPQKSGYSIFGELLVAGDDVRLQAAINLSVKKEDN